VGTGIAERLLALDTCVVSDAMDQLGLRGAITGLGPMWDCGRIAGRVQTVRLRRLRPGERPGGGPHLGARAIERAEPGDVIVVDHQGRDDSAGWGGLLSAVAVLAGVAGVIVDGACRDLEEAAAAGLPLYARSATPVSARGRTVEEACGVAVEIGGVAVGPEDHVIADRSGVVVLPAGMAGEILARAEALVGRERDLLAALRRRVPVSQVMDRRYETMLEDRSPRRTGTC
jgi:4-hydroxy-4-methyl-2-oxoglutarate aldolase